MGNVSLNICGNKGRSGIVLLITLVLLVVLATLGYTLTSRVAAQRHRNQYIIDYSQARYSCDSAVKYTFATMQELSPQLISRPNEPDFSDLFVLSETEIKERLDQWAAENADGNQDSLSNIKVVADINNIDSAEDIDDIYAGVDPTKFGSLTIRGPYGPAWPFVTEPVEFEIGSSIVRITVEDENAKYPIGWMMLNDQQVQREVEAGFVTFCEWMGLEQEHLDSLRSQLNQVSQIKPFELEFKRIKKTTRVPVTTQKTIRTVYRPQTTTITASEQLAKQNVDFAKLLHSSLIDTEALAKPYIQGRKESALKYMGMWGTRKININTAPRHVLEAAFAFGGISDAPVIAEQIIERRRVEPFTDIEELKKELIKYSDSISKCEEYITTVSSFLTIKVTAVSGVAKASATIAIMKDGEKVKRIAIVSG